MCTGGIVFGLCWDCGGIFNRWLIAERLANRRGIVVGLPSDCSGWPLDLARCNSRGTLLYQCLSSKLTWSSHHSTKVIPKNCLGARRSANGMAYDCCGVAETIVEGLCLDCKWIFRGIVSDFAFGLPRDFREIPWQDSLGPIYVKSRWPLIILNSRVAPNSKVLKS